MIEAILVIFLTIAPTLLDEIIKGNEDAPRETREEPVEKDSNA